MLIVGDNLKELCTQHGLVDRFEAYDVTSLTLRLHHRFTTSTLKSKRRCP